MFKRKRDQLCSLFLPKEREGLAMFKRKRDQLSSLFLPKEREGLAMFKRKRDQLCSLFLPKERKRGVTFITAAQREKDGPVMFAVPS